MTKKRVRVTDTAIRIARELPSAYKYLLAVAGILAVLYGGIRFVVDVEYERHEKLRQKISRQEYSKNKERVEAQIKELDEALERLDDRVDKIEARR